MSILLWNQLRSFQVDVIKITNINHEKSIIFTTHYNLQTAK